jgi:hypothetical protein
MVGVDQSRDDEVIVTADFLVGVVLRLQILIKANTLNDPVPLEKGAVSDNGAGAGIRTSLSDQILTVDQGRRHNSFLRYRFERLNQPAFRAPPGDVLLPYQGEVYNIPVPASLI